MNNYRAATDQELVRLVAGCRLHEARHGDLAAEQAAFLRRYLAECRRRRLAMGRKRRTT